MIAAEKISIGYDSRSLIRDLNFELPSGSILSIIGSNGSGKSSLIRVLNGLQEPNQGGVKWKGESLSAISPRERVKAAASLYSNFSRVEGFSVRDLVSLGRTPYTDFFGRLKAKDREMVDYAMTETGISDFADKAIRDLSDGEFRKAMLAKLLAQDTDILFLDEPTTHLDLPAAIEFASLLKKMAGRGKTVIFSTHHLSLAFKMSNSVLLLDGKGEWAMGDAEEIMSHELLCHFLKTDKIRVENGDLKFDL